MVESGSSREGESSMDDLIRMHIPGGGVWRMRRISGDEGTIGSGGRRGWRRWLVAHRMLEA